MKCQNCGTGAYISIVSHDEDSDGNFVEQYVCGSCDGRGTLRVRLDPGELPRESYGGILAAGGF